MTKFSFYEDIFHSVPQGTADFETLLNVMRTEKLKQLTEGVRMIVDEMEQQEYKKHFPNITINGIFRKRSNEDLLHYNQVTAIDMDHVPPELLPSLRDYLCSHPFTHFLFTSPRGQGIKLVVRHNNENPELHTSLYPQLLRYYQEALRIPYVDKVVRDLSRATYMAYDENAYYNPNSEVFHFDFNHIEPAKTVSTKAVGVERKKIEVPMTADMIRKNQWYQMTWKDKALMDYIDKYQWQHFPEDYQVGNRNDSLIKKATQLCRCGVDYELALWKLNFLYGRAGVSEGDVEERVSYSYQNNAVDFGIDRYQWQKKRDAGIRKYRS